MSQNPQGSNPEDSDPEYNQLNEQLAEPSAQEAQDSSGQPAMLPEDTVQKIIGRLRVSGPLRLPWCSVLSAWFAWVFLPACLLSSWAISVCLKRRKRSAWAFRLQRVVG